MKHLFIMDPLEQVNPAKDTTYILMLACAERGHEVAFTQQSDLFLQHDLCHTQAKWLTVQADYQQPFLQYANRICALSEFDVVWLRTDPPFDRRYFYTTLMLDRVPNKTRVLNSPQGVRDLNEKLSSLYMANATPTTLVTSDINRIKKFAKQYDRITLKPIDGFAGRGVVFYSDGQDDCIIHEITHSGSHWVIVQEYMAAAKDGDKRILLHQGNMIGAVLRLHAQGQELNNLDAGGRALPAQITDKEAQVCENIKPLLLHKGIFFAGLDFIGDKLIEVNVTSPTCLQQLIEFSGQQHHHDIIASLEP